MAKDEEKVVATEAEAEPKAKKPAAKKAAEKPAEDKKETKEKAETKAEVEVEKETEVKVEAKAEAKAEVKAETAEQPEKEVPVVEPAEQKAAPEAAPAAAPAAPAAHSSSSGHSHSSPRSYGGGDRNYGDRRGGPRQRRRKVCQFCVDRQDFIDYKDTGRLRKFISERAKIIPRRVTGTCARHQRELTTAIKNARQIALLPYVSD